MVHFVDVYFVKTYCGCFIPPIVLVGLEQIPLPVAVYLAYLLPGRLMAILIQGDAQLAQVMLHRQQRFL